MYLGTPAKRRAEKQELAFGYPGAFSHVRHPMIYTTGARKELHGRGPQNGILLASRMGGSGFRWPLLMSIKIIPRFFGGRKMFLYISIKSRFPWGIAVLSG
jgi:hypothetical protein